MTISNRYLDAATVEQLNHLRLAARSIVEGSATGLHRSQFKGASVEFRQHRAYVPGDEPRRLDWRVLARTQRPFVKEYDEETNLRCVMILDNSGSMAYGTHTEFSKVEFAKRLVAGLSYLMLAANESVGFSTIAQDLQQWIAPVSGSTQLARIMSSLDDSIPQGSAQFQSTVSKVANRLGRRALVIMISDFFSPIDQIHTALARLRHDRHELICLRVLHPDEISFPLQNWTLLQGLENERALLCEPAIARQNYLDNFEKHSRSLVNLCRTLSAEFHVMMCDQSIADAVTRFLKIRSGR